MRFKFHKATASIEIDGKIELTEEDMASLAIAWEKGMKPLLERREAKRLACEEESRRKQLEAKQERVTVEGENWVVQTSLTSDTPIHAWPAKHKSRDVAPFSIEFNPARIKRPYGVTIRRRGSATTTWPYLELGGYYYEDIEAAIASTIKRRDSIEEAVKAQRG